MHKFDYIFIFSLDLTPGWHNNEPGDDKVGKFISFFFSFLLLVQDVPRPPKMSWSPFETGHSEAWKLWLTTTWAQSEPWLWCFPPGSFFLQSSGARDLGERSLLGMKLEEKIIGIYKEFF